MTDQHVLYVTRMEALPDVEYQAYLPYPESSFFADADAYCEMNTEVLRPLWHQLIDKVSEMHPLFRKMNAEGRKLILQVIDEFLQTGIKNMHRFRIGHGMVRDEEKENHQMYAIASVRVNPLTFEVKLMLRLNLVYKPLEMGPKRTVKTWSSIIELQV